VCLAGRARRFVDEKFPEDKLQRRLIALAYVVGPIPCFANWYFTARFGWDLFHQERDAGSFGSALVHRDRAEELAEQFC
jgi:hypothetical protein